MDEYNPYKNMTLRQELEARFDEVDRKQKEQDALDYIRNNMQNVTNKIEFDKYNKVSQVTTQQSPIQQIIGGAMDMVSEYFKMKKHG